jgi:hypothetical protein
VVNGYPLYDRVACIIDIGGGSTEFVVADGDQPYLVDSVKLGSLRLYDAYLRGRSDPVRAARRLDEHINEMLAPLAERIRRYRLDLALGTSGTIMGLAAVDAAARGLAVKRVHGYALTRTRLEVLQSEMLEMSEAERRRMPGMNPRRADIIVAGNAVLIAALTLLDREELIVSAHCATVSSSISPSAIGPWRSASATNVRSGSARSSVWRSATNISAVISGTWRGWRWCSSSVWPRSTGSPPPTGTSSGLPRSSTASGGSSRRAAITSTPRT